MYHYAMSGLLVASEMRLASWHSAQVHPDDETRFLPDISIVFTNHIPAPDNPTSDHEWFTSADGFCRIKIDDGFEFCVEHGNRIAILRTGNIADADIDLFLIGSAWGVLCHQRGLLPLHCSAVQSSSLAFAFTGESGAGKSTLAAALAQRGLPHLCDDVAIVEAGTRGNLLWPMPKGLKLWRDATNALGLERGASVGTYDVRDKFFVEVPAAQDQTPLKLGALYLLEDSQGAPPSITKIRGGSHFHQLFSNVYRAEWLPWIREPAEVFAQLAELSAGLGLYRFSRPRDLQKIAEGTDMIEEHMASLVANG